MAYLLPSLKFESGKIIAVGSHQECDSFQYNKNPNNFTRPYRYDSKTLSQFHPKVLYTGLNDVVNVESDVYICFDKKQHLPFHFISHKYINDNIRYEVRYFRSLYNFFINTNQNLVYCIAHFKRAKYSTKLQLQTTSTQAKVNFKFKFKFKFKFDKFKTQ